MRLAPSRAISSSVSVISPACTEEVSVDSLSMGGVSFPPPASGVFVCWAHAEGYAALFHPIKSRDPQLLRIPPHRLARGAWKEYDACAPSGCVRVRGILLGGSPRILRLQTVFRILSSAHSCRIRVDRAPRHLFLPGVVGLGPGRGSTIVEWFNVAPSTAGGAPNHATVERANWFNLEPSVARSRRQEGALVIPARLRRRFGLAKGPPSSLRKPRRGSSSDPPRSRWRCT